MRALDFIVIGGYAIGMLAVGWYYGRRARDAEQYLLGGRNMNPFMIGLSLFATLTSTLSYLALPGEIIAHGPMILAQLAAYPVAALVVGWLLIPSFMKFKVTSAYELLESRLGISGRLLGAGMFLALRLIWMAGILYATTDKVLAPLLNLPAWAVPYACVAMGVITVIYTSEGGLRAVVFTDALQAFIMLGGAAVCLVVVSVRLGGWNAWWPAAWPTHWDEPVWWDSSAAHVTLVGAFVSMLAYWICTAGSDQMAVQRYLATRDVKAARRAFSISLIADVLVQLLLAMAGMAVLAYFLAQPDRAADRGDLIHSADELFPRFIVEGLPAGLTGLLIAAILSAAMSSLSSGVNSACAVIMTDFIGTFRRQSLAPTQNVRLARQVSVAVGAAMIVSSAWFGQVPGNLLEKCFKLVNLLTAPLFVLFFLALFVRWATPLGAYAATVVSVTVAIGVSFLGWFGLGFLWSNPCSLLAGVLAGMVTSLIPLGRLNHRPMT